MSALQEYYASIPTEDGFAGLCRVVLPDGLQGKTILDVNCRHGKGAYKLSAKVGADGKVIGIDPSPAFVAKAIEGVPHALERSGLDKSNLEFRVGYPESTGQADESVDIVYANSSLNVAMDLKAALVEAFRVLKPGGLLLVDGVVADGMRDERVVAEAKRLGNAVQAAPSLQTMEELPAEAGFVDVVCDVQGSVGISAGRTADIVARAAASNEQVAFFSAIIQARKPR